MDWNVIVTAAHNLHTVEITYSKISGEVVQHEVEPYSTRGNKFYGFRTDVGEIRAFIIDNIIDAIETTNSFSPRWPVEL